MRHLTITALYFGLPAILIASCSGEPNSAERGKKNTAADAKVNAPGSSNPAAPAPSNSSPDSNGSNASLAVTDVLQTFSGFKPVTTNQKWKWPSAFSCNSSTPYGGVFCHSISNISNKYTYEFDQNGRLTKITSNGSTQNVVTLAWNNQRLVTQITSTYLKSGRRYTYDAKNRVASVTAFDPSNSAANTGAATIYEYSDDGSVITKSIPIPASPTNSMEYKVQWDLAKHTETSWHICPRLKGGIDCSTAKTAEYSTVQQFVFMTYAPFDPYTSDLIPSEIRPNYLSTESGIVRYGPTGKTTETGPNGYTAESSRTFSCSVVDGETLNCLPHFRYDLCDISGCAVLNAPNSSETGKIVKDQFDDGRIDYRLALVKTESDNMQCTNTQDMNLNGHWTNQFKLNSKFQTIEQTSVASDIKATCLYQTTYDSDEFFKLGAKFFLNGSTSARDTSSYSYLN